MVWMTRYISSMTGVKSQVYNKLHTGFLLHIAPGSSLYSSTPPPLVSANPLDPPITPSFLQGNYELRCRQP